MCICGTRTRSARCIWYKTHLNAPVRAGFPDTGLTEANCRVPRGEDRTWPALNREGMFRTPRAGVEFGDVVLTWYANQGSEPLVSSRGQMQDHIGLSVGDLDAWIDKLKGEGVTFLDGPVPARRHPRRDDRRPEPRGDRTGRDQITLRARPPAWDRWNLRRSPPVVSSG